MSDNNYAEWFRFSSQHMAEDTFRVVRFRGTEGLNKLFSFSIDLVSREDTLDMGNFLASPAQFTILRASGQHAHFHGYPARMEQGGHFQGFTYYTVELRPLFWKLTQIRQSAIFLEKTAEDVAGELLNAQQFLKVPHDFRLKPGSPRPEFAMQYEESLYDYILWRMEEQGAYFYFAPDEDKVIFADAPMAHSEHVGVLHYSPTTGLEAGKRDEVLQGFTLAQTTLPQRVIVRSYDWKNPNKAVIGTADVALNGLGDVYLTSENVTTDEDAQRVAEIRAEELICKSRVFTGMGTAPTLRPGVVFTLDRHYSASFNRDYLLTEITHEGAQEAFISLGLGIPLRDAKEHIFYHNTFACIESDVQYRPARTAQRSQVPGVIRAFVDGAGSGARAEMDEYGRYKLLFPFDLSGRGNGNASCWIRLAGPQAGKDSGLSFPLLPGTEVVVSFLDGNPDRPIITGSLPNGETGSISGPENANISGIRTPGGNQITINDTNTKQGISLHTATGNGLSVMSGSLDMLTSSTDLRFAAAGVASTSLATLGQSMLSANTISQSVQGKLWIKIARAALTAASATASSTMKLLSSADRAKAIHDGKTTEVAAKDAFAACATDSLKQSVALILSGIIDLKNLKKSQFKYGASLTVSASGSSSQLRTKVMPSELATAIAFWAGLRATSEGFVGKYRTDQIDKLDTEIENATGEKETAALELQKKNDVEDKAALELQKKNAVRERIISPIKSLIPEIAAYVIATITYKKSRKEELGGVCLHSKDNNINLSAKETVSLHSNTGIVLNTSDVTKKGGNADWGRPPLAGTFQAAEKFLDGSALKDWKPNGQNDTKKQCKQVRRFVGVNTGVAAVQADHVLTCGKENILSCAKRQILQTDYGTSCLIDQEQGIHLNTDRNVTIANEHAVLGLDKDGLLAASNEKTGLSLDTKSAQLSGGTNKPAVLGLSDKGAVLATNRKTGIGIKDDTVYIVANKKVKIEGVNFQQSKIDGVTDISKAIKIISPNPGPPSDIFEKTKIQPRYNAFKKGDKSLVNKAADLVAKHNLSSTQSLGVSDIFENLL